jgi:hypothetical protein
VHKNKVEESNKKKMAITNFFGLLLKPQPPAGVSPLALPSWPATETTVIDVDTLQEFKPPLPGPSSKQVPKLSSTSDSHSLVVQYATHPTYMYSATMYCIQLEVFSIYGKIDAIHTHPISHDLACLCDQESYKLRNQMKSFSYKCLKISSLFFKISWEKEFLIMLCRNF